MMIEEPGRAARGGVDALVRRCELHGAPLPPDLRGDPRADLQLGAPGPAAAASEINVGAV